MKGITRGARTRQLNAATPRTRELMEYSQAKPDRVDKEAGIIYGVRMLGQKSRNNHGERGVDETFYTDAAMRDGLPLYEGLPANANHGPRSNSSEARSAYDRIGKYQNVEFRPGQGYFGNLKLFKSHPLAGPLMEAAESADMSDLFACSHHAYGRGTVQGRTLVIDKIPVVKSVDIVTAGGTVRGLFEGRQTMKKISEVLEALEAKLDEARRPKLRALLEADVLPETAEMDDEGGDDDPDAKMLAAFKAALCAVIDDDALSEAEQLSKIKEILKAKAKLMGGDDEEESDDESSDDSDSTETETKESLREKAQKDPTVRKLLESHERLTAKIAAASRRTKNRKLLESAKLPETARTKRFVQLVEDAPDEASARRLIENQREAIGVTRAKSAGSGHGGNMGGGSLTTKEAVASFSQQVRGF